jgi:hypothetical protein
MYLSQEINTGKHNSSTATLKNALLFFSTKKCLQEVFIPVKTLPVESGGLLKLPFPLHPLRGQVQLHLFGPIQNNRHITSKTGTTLLKNSTIIMHGHRS